MNKFLLEILVEYFCEGEFQEELTTATIYADQDFFKVRNSVLEQWEADNPEKELTDYTVTNQRQYNKWLATQLSK